MTEGTHDGLVVVMRVDGVLEIITRADPPALREVQELLDGYVEMLQLDCVWDRMPSQMYVDEEGKLKGLQPNLTATEYARTANPYFEDTLVGTAVLLVGKARWT